MARGELSSFVGRKLQIRQLKELVRSKRLVTLVGVGGVGKTRLATRVASELGRYVATGFWYVDLASVHDAALLPQAAASAVGIVETPTTAVLLALAERFRGGPCLLVLDNCEHLIEAAASVATELLQTSPLLTILATSREPLRCAGEHVYQVPPLEVPAADERQQSLGYVARTEAAQLFLERAADAAGFRPDDRNAADLAALCQRLEGIPLALELAAALLRTLNLHQLAERSVDALHLFSAGSRLAPRRQQTLEATIDWSYQLLSSRERRVFENLAVFAGGMSLEAVEAVCEDISRDIVLPTLSALVDKSLVFAEPAIEPGPRFGLLETVRQFSRLRLDKGGRRAVETRHAMYFLRLAEKSAARRRQSNRQNWQDQLAVDNDNLRLALRYFEANESEQLLRMAGAMWQFWSGAGLYHEGINWLEKALSSGATGTIRERANAICGLVELRWPTGYYDGMVELSRESLQLARDAGDVWLTAFSLYHLAIPAVRAGETSRAVDLTEKSLALARTTGDPWLKSYMLNALGNCVERAGDLMRARDLYEAALELARTEGDDLMGAYQLSCLARVARAQHELEQAEALTSETLAVAVRFGDWRLAAYQLLALASLAFQAQRRAEAAKLLGAGEALCDRLRVAYEFPLPELDPLRAMAAQGALASAREKGRALHVNQVVAGMMNRGVNGASARSRTYGPLTTRETEVARLVVNGWSNRAIAEQLVVAERTVENHVSHILDKLGLSSRTQLASRLSSEWRDVV